MYKRQTICHCRSAYRCSVSLASFTPVWLLIYFPFPFPLRSFFLHRTMKCFMISMLDAGRFPLKIFGFSCFITLTGEFMYLLYICFYFISFTISAEGLTQVFWTENLYNFMKELGVDWNSTSKPFSFFSNSCQQLPSVVNQFLGKNSPALHCLWHSTWHNHIFKLL